MNDIITILPDMSSDPVWPKISVDIIDFRSICNGNLINIFTLVSHADLENGDLRELILNRVNSIANWLVETEYFKMVENKFQIIIGWNKSIQLTSRQILKCGGDCDDIRKIISGETVVQFLKNWDKGVNPK
jgi:hypothetical protein